MERPRLPVPDRCPTAIAVNALLGGSASTNPAAWREMEEAATAEITDNDVEDLPIVGMSVRAGGRWMSMCVSRNPSRSVRSKSAQSVRFPPLVSLALFLVRSDRYVLPIRGMEKGIIVS